MYNSLIWRERRPWSLTTKTALSSCWPEDWGLVALAGEGLKSGRRVTQGEKENVSSSRRTLPVVGKDHEQYLYICAMRVESKLGIQISALRPACISQRLGAWGPCYLRSQHSKHNLLDSEQLLLLQFDFFRRLAMVASTAQSSYLIFKSTRRRRHALCLLATRRRNHALGSSNSTRHLSGIRPSHNQRPDRPKPPNLIIFGRSAHQERPFRRHNLERMFRVRVVSIMVRR